MMSPQGIAVRAAACVALLSSVSCTAMLEPERLEKAAYGMPHDQVERVLDVAVQDRLRVLPAEPGGPEWVIDGYWSEHPHPHYAMAYREGVLVSVLLQNDIPEDARYLGGPIGPEEIASLVAAFEAERHPLTWAELEPIDTAAHRKELHPTTYTVMMLIAFPPALVGVALVPVIWLTLPLCEGDVHAMRRRLSAKALSLPVGCTREQALAVLGEPGGRQQPEGAPTVELWSYWVEDRMTSSFSCRLGFVGDRLGWVQASQPGKIPESLLR